MATKHFCDRCDEEISDSSELDILEVCLIRIHPERESISETRSGELCKDCVNYAVGEFKHAISKFSITKSV